MKESRGNFFQKVSSGKRAFLFLAFLCASFLQRKATMEVCEALRRRTQLTLKTAPQGFITPRRGDLHSLSTAFSTGFPTFRQFSGSFPQAAFFTGFVPFVLFLLPGRALFPVQCFCRLPFFKIFSACFFPKAAGAVRKRVVVTVFAIFNRHLRFSTPPPVFHTLFYKFSFFAGIPAEKPFFTPFCRPSGAGGKLFSTTAPHAFPQEKNPGKRGKYCLSRLFHSFHRVYYFYEITIQLSHFYAGAKRRVREKRSFYENHI